MQRGHAPVKYVHTRVVQYYPSIVDLRWCRSIHSCEVCPYGCSTAAPHDSETSRSGGGVTCNAIHYGVCTPVKNAFVNGPRQAPPLPAAPVKRKITVPVVLQVCLY